MSEHPFIATLKTTGDATRRLAHALIGPDYDDPLGQEAARLLADALVEDHLGSGTGSDWTARERHAQRSKIATIINDLGPEYRDRLYAELAAGNGVLEAEALMLTAATQADLLIDTVNRLAENAQKC